MDENKKEATPIEVAALMMDAVCTPSNQEEDALRELATHLQVALETIQTELLYLRAFAVDFAAAVTLADSAEKTAVVDQYNGHWALIGKEAGQGVLDELELRVRAYTEAVADTAPNPEGLRGLVGTIFARICVAADGSRSGGHPNGRDLAFLGGAMFAALFDEMADLFNAVDIVLPASP